MGLRLTSPARFALVLVFVFFAASVLYNFHNAPGLDLNPPHGALNINRPHGASSRAGQSLLNAAKDACHNGKALIPVLNSNGADLPFEMFEESLCLMGRAEHRERLEHLVGKTLPAWRIPLTSDTNCHHSLDRNYTEHPIILTSQETKLLETCNVPCTTPKGYGKPVIPDVFGPVTSHGTVSKSSCTRRIRFSMENSHFSSDSRDTFDGTPQLSSSIPIQYMDWNAFRFWDHVKSKKKNAAAFISNCGFGKRNKLVRDLQQYGVDVQSYGLCMNNAKEPGGRRKAKLLRSYRFSLAFENSETPDYITEKFFDALMSGAVPVYLGAGNVRLFAPSDHSFIDVNAFESTQALAKHLLYLEKNETAYREYLQWKIDGYSDDFQALVDLSCFHSLCRSCLLAADIFRLDYGSSVLDAPLSVHTQLKLRIHTSRSPSPLLVRLRERGSYRFVDVTLYDRTFTYLVDAALRYVEEHHKERWGNDREAFTFTWNKLADDGDEPYPPKEKHKSKVVANHRKKVYGLYTVGYKDVLLNDASVAKLSNGAEVEVIFV